MKHDRQRSGIEARDVRSEVSAEEWAKRVDLAAAYRLVHLYGMDEMIANHISARVPGEDGAFLINPYGLLYEQMHASCFVKLDLDGAVLYNPTAYGINQAGYVLHSAVHRARHGIDCVIHTHTLAGMAVSAMKCGLLVGGASIPEAFNNIFRLERACQLQGWRFPAIRSCRCRRASWSRRPRACTSRVCAGASACSNGRRS